MPILDCELFSVYSRCSSTAAGFETFTMEQQTTNHKSEIIRFVHIGASKNDRVSERHVSKAGVKGDAMREADTAGAENVNSLAEQNVIPDRAGGQLRPRPFGASGRGWRSHMGDEVAGCFEPGRDCLAQPVSPSGEATSAQGMRPCPCAVAPLLACCMAAGAREGASPSGRDVAAAGSAWDATCSTSKRDTWGSCSGRLQRNYSSIEDESSSSSSSSFDEDSLAAAGSALTSTFLALVLHAIYDLLWSYCIRNPDT